MGEFKVAKWGKSLAIRILASVAKELGIKEGDMVSRDVLRLRKVIPQIDRGGGVRADGEQAVEIDRRLEDRSQRS